MRRLLIVCLVIACGGNAAPPPVATKSTAPSATASAIAVAPVEAGVVESAKPAHAPPPLLARVAGAVCTWQGRTSDPLPVALRGDATGDVLAHFDDKAATLHLFLARSGAFVEIDAPHGAKIHAYVHDPLGLHARHDIAIGDILTLKQGAAAEVSLDEGKLVVTATSNVTFTGGLRPKATIACDDVAFAASKAADQPRRKIFAILGTRPVPLYAQTTGSQVAVAHDDAAEVVEQQGAWTKLMLEDDAVRVTAWVKTSSVTITHDPAKFLAAKVTGMQMQMLGAFGGVASVAGAKDPHHDKKECDGEVTVFLRKRQDLFPMVRLAHPTLELHSGGVVDLPASLGIKLEPGVMAAISSEDEAICH